MSTETETKDPVTPEDLQKKAIEAAVAAELQDIKRKLDSSFAQRDAALQKVAEFEAKQREAELKKLEEEGKHKEVYEQRLAEERAAREVLEKKNIELTRDITLNSALQTLDFKTPRAMKLAYNEIVGEVVKNEAGHWVHKSGKEIGDFLAEFAADPEQAFLFKPKVSSGTGTTQGSSTTSERAETSLFKMSQAEVLKRAEVGKLPTRRR